MTKNDSRNNFKDPFSSKPVKLKLQPLIFVLVIIICVFAVTQDFSHTACLRIQDKYVGYKGRKKISLLKSEIDSIYRKIGQKVYHGGNIDGLISRVDKCEERISSKEKDISMYHLSLE